MKRMQFSKAQDLKRQLSDMQEYLRMNKKEFCSKDQSHNFSQKGSFDLESSPQFRISNQANFQNDFFNDYALISHPSQISIFSESRSVKTSSENQNFIVQKEQKNARNKQTSQFLPSLESFYSVDMNQVKGKSLLKRKQSSVKFSYQNKLQSLSSVQLPSKQFIPNIRVLTHHIDFLQQEIFKMKKYYLRLKQFSQAVIDALKITGSYQVGSKLQEYMVENIINPKILSFLSQQNCNKNLTLESQLSSKFIERLKSQSLSYSHQLESQRLSDTIQNIFTLGGQNQYLMKDIKSKFPYNKSCKSTERKTRNFKKIKNDKENVSNINFSSNSTSKKVNNDHMIISQAKIKDKSEFSSQTDIKHKVNTDQKRYQKMMKKNNDFQKQQQNKIISSKKDKNSSKKGMIQSKKNILQDFDKDEATIELIGKQLRSYRLIAHQIMCEFCGVSFKPRQFLDHSNYCKTAEDKACNQRQENSLKGMNDSVLIQNLIQMKEQIEEQIELLSQQKERQKTKQKSQRGKLRDQLQGQLAKITRIIKNKQKLLRVYSN